jgi:hypothetical protein
VKTFEPNRVTLPSGEQVETLNSWSKSGTLPSGEKVKTFEPNRATLPSGEQSGVSIFISIGSLI